MSDSPYPVLAELVTHLAYDADVNGTKFTDTPVGRLALSNSPDAIWRRVCERMNQCVGPEQVLLAQLMIELIANAQEMGASRQFVGTLSLQTSEGSLWKKTIDFLGYEPEMIRDVIAPAIKKYMAQ